MDPIIVVGFETVYIVNFDEIKWKTLRITHNPFIRICCIHKIFLKLLYSSL